MLVKPATLSISINTTPEVADLMLGELEAKFGDSVILWTCARYPNTENEYVYQGTVKNRDAAIRILVGVIRIMPDFSDEVRPYIDVAKVDIINDWLTEMDKFLLTSLVQLTRDCKSNIIAGFTESQALKGVVEQLSNEMQALASEVKGIRIYNETFIIPMKQSVCEIADFVGLEEKDIFPTTYHKVH